jgi:hypothetical protein
MAEMLFELAKRCGDHSGALKRNDTSLHSGAQQEVELAIS